MHRRLADFFFSLLNSDASRSSEFVQAFRVRHFAALQMSRFEWRSVEPEERVCAVGKKMHRKDQNNRLKAKHFNELQQQAKCSVDHL